MDIISRTLNNLCCFDNSYPELGYNTDSNEEVCLLHKDHNNDVHAEVVSIAFSHNSRYIAVGTMNGCLKIYTFPPLQELIDSNRNRFKNRHLTTEERKKFYLE
jgi:hypothetical protein